MINQHPLNNEPPSPVWGREVYLPRAPGDTSDTNDKDTGECDDPDQLNTGRREERHLPPPLKNSNLPSL